MLAILRGCLEKRCVWNVVAVVEGGVGGVGVDVGGSADGCRRRSCLY